MATSPLRRLSSPSSCTSFASSSFFMISFISILIISSLSICSASLLTPDLIVCGSGAPVTCLAPSSVFVSANGRDLYISDSGNNRVLRYPSVDTLTSTTSPNGVFGQSDTTTTGPNGGAGPASPDKKSLYNPHGIFVDETADYLIVADTGNNRVVAWQTPATRGSGTPWHIVLGQSSFTANGNSPTTATTLNAPQGVWSDSSATWVADTGNNRVLRYASIGSVSTKGESASLALGQTTGLSSSTPSFAANGLTGPTNVLTDGSGNVFVADTTNNRVLYYAQPSTNGASASYAFGQSATGSGTTSSTSATTIKSAIGLSASPDGTLFLSSQSENRVLAYSGGVVPTSSGASASLVIGQSSLTGETTTYLNTPRGIFYDSSKNTLWVADSANNRVVRYSDVILGVMPGGGGGNNGSNSGGMASGLTFEGRKPNAVLAPKDNAGEDVVAARLTIRPTVIEEKDSNDNTVSTFILPEDGYNITSYADNNNTQHYTFTLYSPPVTFMYSLFQEAVPLSSAGISFQSKPGGLKLTVAIGQWNFSAPTNRLDLHMYLNYTSPVTSLSQDNTTITTDLSVFDIYTSGVQLTTTLTLLNKAEVDGVATSISYELNPQGSSVDLLLHFPHHTTTLLYDPDFSLLLSTDSSDNGGDTSSDDNTMLALVALVAVVPACACVVVVVGTVWYVAVRLRRSRLRGQAEQGNDVVNF